MSQCFKLVNAGYVDKVIVLDSIPERLYKTVRTRPADGFPRTWAKWLVSIGSTRTVYKTETSVDLARNWTYKLTPIGKEPCFYVLEYQDINADKETWRLICEHIRSKVGPEVRIREKIEDMAIQLSASPTQDVSIEPEDVPIIPIPGELKAAEVSTEQIVKPGETIIVQETAPKKRGRPKKVPLEV